MSGLRLDLSRPTRSRCLVHRAPRNEHRPDADCTCREPFATWRRAKDDPENGQLTSRTWGPYDRVHLEHGWWVNPTSWGLGVDLDAWWATDGRIALIFRVGPFTWGIDLCKAVTR